MVVSIGVFVGEILVAHSKRAALKANKELLKIVDKNNTKSNDFEFPIQPVLRSLNSDLLIMKKNEKKMMKMKKNNLNRTMPKNHNFFFEYLE
jgi:hypothetical protein